MNLSDGERLIVVMLAEVMQKLEIDQEIDPALILKLAYGRDDWAIKHKYPHLFTDVAVADELVEETINILWMWGIIEHRLAQLAGEEAAAAAEWLYTQFTGFDGNHDSHYGIAITLIRDLEEFEDFTGRDLNSHTQATLERYREMYEKFDGYLTAGEAAPLSFEALRDLCS
jgi:uncharacterized protein